MEPGGARIPLPQLRRGVLEMCVLALLDQSGRSYAYDIVSALGDAGMVTSEGTVYPLLSRLRREGHVATDWVESPSGPPRRYYALTPEGRAALAAYRADWAAFRTTVEKLLEAA